MQPPLAVAQSSAVVRTSINETLDALKDAIWSRRPILGDIMQKHGDKSLFDYARDFMDVNPLPRIDFRKGELISVSKKVTERILGKDIAEAVAEQLTKLPLISTADHHSPLMHPFFVNSNIITALPILQSPDPLVRFVIVFSFSGVSNNNLVFPRGIVFHGGSCCNGELIRLPLLPDKLKMSAVHATRSLTPEDVKRGLYLLKSKIGCEVTEQKYEAVANVLKDFFLDPQVMSLQDYSSQISLINYKMWPKFFHNSVSNNSISDIVPQLIYLDIEEIVTEILLAFHLENNHETLIGKALFDTKFINLILKYFDGISGAFSILKNWGTHLFWGLDSKSRRVRLLYKEGSICSEDGTIMISLTPKAIESALLTKQIFPSMALCYLVVSLYYGMKCLGGFSQVHDLTLLKYAWQQVLRDAAEGDQADAIDNLQTKELGGDGLVLSYFRTTQGELKSATGLDMLTENMDTRLERFIGPSKEITLSEAMLPLLPEIYTVLYSAEERDPNLALSSSDIMAGSTLEEKINKYLF